MTALLPTLILLASPQATPEARLEECRKNLLELGKLVPVWTERTKNQNGRGGNERGREFWSAMTRIVPPLIPKEREVILKCPLSGTAYRGPRSEIGGSDTYLACCEPYHPGGAIHALDRNARIVLTLTPASPEYRKALEQTRGNFASDLDQFFEAEQRVAQYRQTDPSKAVANLRSIQSFLWKRPEMKLGDPEAFFAQIAELEKLQAPPAIGNPQFDAWKNFKAGSWVKLKVETIEDGEKTVSEETETLVSATAEKIVLQRKTLSTLGGQPFTSTDQEDLPATTPSILKVEKGTDEEIEVAGKKVACRVLLVTKAAKESVGEIRHKFWMKDDVPGGVVRSESVAVRQNRVVATAVALGWEKK